MDITQTWNTVLIISLTFRTFGKDIRNTQQWSLPQEMFGYILKQEMFGWSWQ